MISRIKGNVMKFKITKSKDPITSKDYIGKPCTLSGTERSHRWALNNPTHPYTLKHWPKWIKRVSNYDKEQPAV